MKIIAGNLKSAIVTSKNAYAIGSPTDIQCFIAKSIPVVLSNLVFLIEAEFTPEEAGGIIPMKSGLQDSSGLYAAPNFLDFNVEVPNETQKVNFRGKLEFPIHQIQLLEYGQSQLDFRLNDICIFSIPFELKRKFRFSETEDTIVIIWKS